MSNIIIKDKLTLRQFAIQQATMAVTSSSILSKEPYDINNHLDVAKAIEQYVLGEGILPEQEKDNKDEWYSKMLDSLSQARPVEVVKSPNFKVKE